MPPRGGGLLPCEPPGTRTPRCWAGRGRPPRVRPRRTPWGNGNSTRSWCAAFLRAVGARVLCPPTRDEGVPRVLDGGERHEIPACQGRGEPDRQNADLAFPAGHREHVITPVHQPRRESLDDEALVLEDAPPQPQGRHH